MSFAAAFYIALNQLSCEQLDHRMGLGGLNLIEPAVFLNMLRIIVIAKNLKEWRDWPMELVITKLIHFNAIQRLATPMDLVKIEKALSTPVQQYLNGISQGEKTPHYYRTAKNHLPTKTIAQAPMVPQPMENRPVSTAQAPMVPQPMGNRPVYNPQSIPPLVSQPVGSNLIFTINSKLTHAAQVPQVPITL